MTPTQRKAKLVFYLDVASAFAYLAFSVISRLRNTVFHNCDIEYVPVQLGKLMAATGNAGPMSVHNKAEYTSHDFQRQAHVFQVPLAPGIPPSFGQPSVRSCANLTAISIHYPERLEVAMAALFHAFWVEHKRVCDPEPAIGILRNLFGEVEAKRIVNELAKDDRTLSQLEEHNKEAFRQLAFGLPYFVATNSRGETDKYFGFDHLGQVIDFLGLQRPGDENWRALI